MPCLYVVGPSSDSFWLYFFATISFYVFLHVDLGFDLPRTSRENLLASGTPNMADFPSFTIDKSPSPNKTAMCEKRILHTVVSCEFRTNKY